MSDFTLDQAIASWESLPPENPTETHLLIMVLLDTSESMRTCQDELNDAVHQLLDSLKQDTAARGAAEVCIVQFGGDVRVPLPFQPLRRAPRPQFVCEGRTPFYQALSVALALLQKRRRELKNRLVPVPLYKPFVFVISDGEPTDDPNEAFQQLLELQKPTRPGAKYGHLFVYPIGLGPLFRDERNQKILASLSLNHDVFTGDYSQLSQCFQFLFSTTSSVLQPVGAQAVELPSPEEFGLNSAPASDLSDKLTSKEFPPRQIALDELMDED